MKQILIWASVVVIVIASIWGLVLLANSEKPSSQVVSNLPKVEKSDIATGSATQNTAKVTLIEYADFQCPACASYHPLVKQLLSDFEGEIYFVYRFFPLTQIHQNAFLASQVALASHNQGKFWEMHDILFENQSSWANSSKAKDIFIEYAKRLNLDIAKLDTDITAASTKDFINKQLNQGIGIGVNATPTFFIDNVKIKNPRSYDDFKNLIQDALNEK